MTLLFRSAHELSPKWFPCCHKQVAHGVVLSIGHVEIIRDHSVDGIVPFLSIRSRVVAEPRVQDPPCEFQVVDAATVVFHVGVESELS
jgi:hypothetical protein